MDHKIVTYQTLSTFLGRDGPYANEVVSRNDKDQDTQRWYSVTSPFYNEPVIPQTDGREEIKGEAANASVEEVDGATANPKEVNEFEKVLKELETMRNATVSADFTSEKAAERPDVDCIVLINPTTRDLEMITLDPKRKSSREKLTANFDLETAEITPKSTELMGARPKTKKNAEKSPKRERESKS